MSRVQHELLPVVTAPVARNLHQTIEDPHFGGRSGESEHASHCGGRNGIVVEIETDIDGLAGANIDNFVGGERMERKRQQTWLLFAEGLHYRTGVIGRPWALVRDVIAPLERLSIALFERGESATRPERIAHIADGTFHPALLIARAHLARAWNEVMVSRQFQQAGIEEDLIVAAFEYGAAQVVIQDDARHAGERFKGMHVTAQEVFHHLIEEELKVKSPRPGQSDDEARQRTSGTADHDVTEVRPIGLRLVGGEGLQTEECFCSSRAQTGDGAAQLPDTAGVAAIPDHLVKPRGAKTGILVQSLAQELQIRIENGRAQLFGAMKALDLNGLPHGVSMQPELQSDGADLPVFGIKVTAYLYAGFGTDHSCRFRFGIRGKGLTKRPARPQ